MPGSNSSSASNAPGGDRRDGEHRGQKLTTRLVRDGDIEAFFGQPPAGTLQAFVAELDGEVAGIVGVVRELNYGKFFADFKPELTPFLKSVAIMRCVKGALRFCDEYRGPMIAIAEHAEGCRILTRLGFEHMEGRYFAWLR